MDPRIYKDGVTYFHEKISKYKKPLWQRDKKNKKLLQELEKGDDIERRHKQIVDSIPKTQFKWDWQAENAKFEVQLMIPVPNIIYRQTETDECHTRDECLKILHRLQKRDIYERDLPDLQYNFYLGGDGVMYEGRGWHVVSTKDPGLEHLDAKSIDIAYIGNFKDKDSIPESMVKAREFFVWYLVINSYVEDVYYVTHLGEFEAVKGINYSPPDTRFDDCYK